MENQVIDDNGDVWVRVVPKRYRDRSHQAASPPIRRFTLLNEESVREIRDAWSDGHHAFPTAIALAEYYAELLGVSVSAVRNVIYKNAWPDVEATATDQP